MLQVSLCWQSVKMFQVKDLLIISSLMNQMREMYEITNDTESENRNKLQHVTQRVNATLRRQKFCSVGQ